MKENRIQFVSDDLVDQIIQGRKTASCEWLDQLGDEDDYNSALTVGKYYTVYRLDKTLACKIRILCLQLVAGFPSRVNLSESLYILAILSIQTKKSLGLLV